MQTFLREGKAVIVLVILIFTIELMAQNGINDNSEYRGNTRVNIKTGITEAMYNINSHVYTGTPEEIAKQFLNENKDTLGISNITDLKHLETIKNPAGKHVGFLQTYNGIPVFGSETVVSINNENRVTMVVNGNNPIKNIKGTVAGISKELAISKAITILNAEEKTFVMKPEAELYIYRDSLDNYFLTWKINFIAQKPQGDWQVFVNANTGEVLKVMDISEYYVNGSGRVFKPDPITDLENIYLSDQNNSDYSALQDAYKTVTLNDLNEPVGGLFRLQGKYARSEDIELPNTTPVTNAYPVFSYNRSQPGFEETNAYYFIDLQRQYVGTLGFSPQWNGQDYILFDAHGFQGENNSKYVPDGPYIAFGDGKVDGAEDLSVIL
jgi:Zn-dependent metalloprotease